MNLAGIEQGVSLYSFNQRYVEVPSYTLENVLVDVKALGLEKYELVGSIVFDQYPRPKREEISEVLRLSDKIGVQPFSYGGYIDYGRVTGREPSDADFIVDLTADLMTARDLGCRYVRETNIPNHLLPFAAELAEYYGVGVGIEVHAPSKPSDENIQSQLAVMDEIDSDLLGMIPDFGCFIERPSAPQLDRYRKLGAAPDLIEEILLRRHSGVSEDELQEDIAGRGGGTAERIAISEVFGYMSFGPADIEGFASLLHRALYFHSKFLHVDEHIEDPSIPLSALLREIVASGFRGVLLSEYEGHAFHNDDAQEQLERHLLLEQRILSGEGTRGS